MPDRAGAASLGLRGRALLGEKRGVKVLPLNVRFARDAAMVLTAGLFAAPRGQALAADQPPSSLASFIFDLGNAARMGRRPEAREVVERCAALPACGGECASSLEAIRDGFRERVDSKALCPALRPAVNEGYLS